MDPKGIFVGIDPGKKGGITQISQGFAPMIHELPIGEDGSWDPKAMRLLADTFKAYGAKVGIEKVHMFPGMSAAASTQVLAGYYLWIGVFAGVGLDVLEVRAEDWRTEFDLKVDIDCKCRVREFRKRIKTTKDRVTKRGLRIMLAAEEKVHEQEKEAAYEARKAKAFAFARLTFGDHFTTPRGRKLDGEAEAAIIALYVQRHRP